MSNVLKNVNTQNAAQAFQYVNQLKQAHMSCQHKTRDHSQPTRLMQQKPYRLENGKTHLNFAACFWQLKQ